MPHLVFFSRLKNFLSLSLDSFLKPNFYPFKNIKVFMIFFFNFTREKKLTFLNTQVELSGQKNSRQKMPGKSCWWWLEKLLVLHTGSRLEMMWLESKEHRNKEGWGGSTMLWKLKKSAMKNWVLVCNHL